MAKGFFTNSAIILLQRVPTAEELQQALEGCEIRGQLQFQEKLQDGTPAPGTNWAGQDVTVVGMAENSRGTVLIDAVPHRWPDIAGQPDAPDPIEDQKLINAYITGHFGPFAFPFCLDRAVSVGQASGYEGAEEAVQQHAAFLRVRSSWAIGVEEDAEAIPADYNAQKELRFLTELASKLLEELPGALCYFNPSGEVLASAEQLETSLDHADKHEMPALELWTNLRLFALEDLEGWALMDTIGMPQLDVYDHEAFFKKGAFEPRELGMFLREASYITMVQGADKLPDGFITRGPGKCDWQALVDRDALVPMPRPVIRWIPLDGSHIPEEIMAKPDRGSPEESAGEGTAG